MLITILEWGISILTSGRGKNKIITCGKIHLPCYCLITVVDSWGQKDRGQRKLPAGQGWKLLFAQLPWDSSDTLYVEGGSSGPYLAPVIMLWLYVHFFFILGRHGGVIIVHVGFSSPILHEKLSKQLPNFSYFLVWSNFNVFKIRASLKLKRYMTWTKDFFHVFCS